MPPLNREALEDPALLAEVFPSLAAAPLAERRTLLRVMAASLALAGCDPIGEDTKWVPAVVAPPGVVPGNPNHYATATASGGTVLGLVVTHDSGRPIKVDGNPLHPASLGATDAVAQALILDFYDPDRASPLLRLGQPSVDGRLQSELLQARERLAANPAALRILTSTVLSPTLGRVIERVLAHYPGAVWVQHGDQTRDSVRRAAMLAYGAPLEVLPHPAEADIVVALDSDLADGAPGWVRHARDLASRRNPVLGAPSRIIAAETVPTAMGVLADRRIAATPAELLDAVLALAAAILRGETPTGPAWAIEAAAALRSAPGRALVHAGPHLPAESQALVHALNEALGGRGHTFTLVPPAEHRPEPQAAAMATLLDDMRAGLVDTLLVLDSNPAFTVPGFAGPMRALNFAVHAGAPDETALAATWHVPLAHEFEAWGDLRAHDGTVAIVQPQAMPMHGGRSAFAVLALLDGDATPAADLVRATWSAQLPTDDAWAGALADGVVPGTANAPLDTPLRADPAGLQPPAPAPETLQVLFRPDPYLRDGRHANNGWLQELPRPFTKMTWENPLLLSPAVARHYALADGDVVQLRSGDTAVELPVKALPGLAAGCVVATTGYGRRTAGAVGRGTGWDLAPLQAAGGPYSMIRTGRTTLLPQTDRGGGWAEHADLLRTASLARFRADSDSIRGARPADSLYRVRPPAPVAWGMVVDLNACIGCNACVVACTAENNVPVVGRENVVKQREMHWLRIDRYWEGPDDQAQAALQPMLCMHCEEAPCETVCPVGASIHDSEGLNLQVYNRCVGTRFCSNNCPYKVRRFNFGPYAKNEPRAALSRNPEVSVRARGVMEKCTFCVQRIARTRIEHDRDGTKEHAVTACQAACPTQVFTFGDLNDPDSAVAKRKLSPLQYALLPDQQTHPRVTYDARVRDRG